MELHHNTRIHKLKVSLSLKMFYRDVLMCSERV